MGVTIVFSYTGSSIKDREVVKCYFLQARELVGDIFLEVSFSNSPKIVEAFVPCFLHWRTEVWKKKVTFIWGIFNEQF
jgi:hypothetical protein